MKNLRKTTLICFLILIQLLLLNLPVFAQDKITDEKEPLVYASSIDEIFYLVKKEYYRDVDQKNILIKSLEELEKLDDTAQFSDKVALIKKENDPDLILYNYRNDIKWFLEENENSLEKNTILKTAISGMLEALNDPYTVYFDEEEYEKFNSSLSGKDFCGIGIYIKQDKDNENMLTIVEPIKNTPADKAGIMAKDIILEIDGISTAGLTMDESLQLLEGPVGSKVKLLILRENKENLNFEIVRDNIHISSVEFEIIENNIGYIKLSVFGEDTNDEISKALRELEKAGVKAYIMDLRNNGGGYVSAAIDVCSKFMPSNSVVVYIKSKTDKSSYNSYGSTYKTLPMAVLVNEHSASASEITAGALQDSKIARIIGVQTFGKGIVQTIFKLEKDGGALKMTTANYLTPEGRDIDKIGLEPDIIVEMDPAEIGKKDDLQMEKAIEYLKSELSE